MSGNGDQHARSWQRGQAGFWRVIRAVTALVMALLFSGGPVFASTLSTENSSATGSCHCNSCENSCCIKEAKTPLERQAPITPPSSISVQDLFTATSALLVQAAALERDVFFVSLNSLLISRPGVPLYLRHHAQLI